MYCSQGCGFQFLFSFKDRSLNFVVWVEMDACGVGLKANVCFGRAKRSSVGSKIWGEGVGGFPKILKRRSSFGVRIKTGAAFAVLTSDVNQETMVSQESPRLNFFFCLIGWIPSYSIKVVLCFRSVCGFANIQIHILGLSSTDV